MKNVSSQPTAEIIATRRWLQEWVVKLNLCPFAAKELAKKSISYYVSPAQNAIDLLSELEARLLLLYQDESVSTELLIHPLVLSGFSDYNQFLDLADQLLEQMDMIGVFQIASFHPNYQFAGCDENAPENYTNRSPYPMLHILRESQVEAAVNAHPDVDAIPERNIELLQTMGIESLKESMGEFIRMSESNSGS